MDVLGVGISAVDLQGAVAEVGRWFDDGERHYVCVTGVHGVMESQTDSMLCDIHNQSGLTVADGAPMLWAGRWAGSATVGRVRGPDLLPAVCELAAQRRLRNYFYGGAPGVADLLASRLAGRFPGLQVAGTHSPPFGPMSADEDEAIVGEISATRPDVVWVGLSTPKQERWMHSHLDRIPATAFFGVGGAFDVHAGLTHQAPKAVQRSGLEWAWRLGQEPKRLWRRYLHNNPRFVAAILRRPPALRSPEGGSRP